MRTHRVAGQERSLPLAELGIHDRGEIVAEPVVGVLPRRSGIALAVPAGVVANQLVAGALQSAGAVDDEIAMSGEPVGEDDRRPLPLAGAAQGESTGVDLELGDAQAAVAERAASRAERRSPVSSNPSPTSATLR